MTGAFDRGPTDGGKGLLHFLSSSYPPSSLCDAIEAHPRAKLYAVLAAFTPAFVQVETQGFDMIE